MSRHSIRTKHRLHFEIPAPDGNDIHEFDTSDKVSETDVGYDIDKSDLLSCDFNGSEEDFLDTFCPADDVAILVRKIEHWKHRLGMNTNLSLQLVPARELGGSGFLGRGVAGADRRSLLIVEYMITRAHKLVLGMAFKGDQWADLVPHELMHIKDVLDQRCPSMYPYQLPSTGWIDFLRHFWIDGYLQEIGAPHFPEVMRISELRDGLREVSVQVNDSVLASVAHDWWGRPMNLQQALQLGLDLGFTLAEDSPLYSWFYRTMGPGGTP